MTGAMYAAVSGLKAHMSALNVIGNNIANVNTAGYKSTRYVFSEELYTSVRGGADGTSQVGGRNPAQIGYGASIGQIDLDMSTKNYSPTGKVTDCMIDGDGFFLVGDKNKNCTSEDSVQGFYLTRLGNLEFKEDGYFCDGDGMVAYGFARVCIPDENGYPTDNYAICPVLTEIRKPMCIKITEEKTNEETGSVEQYVSYEVCYPKYDVESGRVKDWTEAELSAYFESRYADADTVPSYNIQQVDFQSISLDENTGRISAITSDDQAVVVGYLGIGQVDNPNGVTHVDGHYYQALDGAGELHIKSLGGAVAYIPSDDNLQWAWATTNDNGTTWTKVDGKEDGAVYMAFTTVTDENGTTEVAVPDAKPWDGQSQVEVGSAGKTGLVTGGLESSGTDLATEISNMIMIQRGYQANTRIVTVTDSMLEELVNMKR